MSLQHTVPEPTLDAPLLTTETWMAFGTAFGAAVAAWFAGRRGKKHAPLPAETIVAHIPDDLVEAMRAANARDAAMEERQKNIEEMVRGMHGRITEIHRQTSILLDRGRG